MASVTSSMGAMPSEPTQRALPGVVLRHRRGLDLVGLEPLLHHIGPVVGPHRAAHRERVLHALVDPRQAESLRRPRVRARCRDAAPCRPAWRPEASACATVRGKPSRMKPRRASSSSMRSDTMPTTISSETRSPASITALARMPIGVPAVTAARSMSPVDNCGMPNRWRSRSDCVPLPAPGGPRNTILIASYPPSAGTS